jgi:hypothetical protein
VIGEVSSVFVSPFDSVHQTFPEGTKIPGYYANSVGLVIEATGPWCLVAFVFPPFLDGATFSGHVTFRFNDSEDS